jgi:lipoprotein-releasing system permease protein
MKGGPVVFIALRYLLGRGKEGGRYLRGAALGIALSLVPIVVTLVVADGMIQGITDRFLELGSYHLEIFDQRPGGEPATEASAVRKLPGVSGAFVERQGLGILVGKGGKSGATVRAVAPDFLSDPGTARYLRSLDGVARLEGPSDALVGEELARKTGAKVGDTVRLMTARTTMDGRTVPKVSSFVVRGIVSSGYRELDSLWFFVPYEAGKLALAPEASRSFIGVKIDDPYRSAETRALDLQRALPAGFDVYTWYELQESQYRSYQSTRQLLLFIMALIVLVAAVNVASATTMLAVERRRDLAILKSFGAHPRDGERVLLLGALFTGLAGSVAGLSVGLLIAVNVNGLIGGAETILGWATRLVSFFSGSGKIDTPRLLDPGYYLETIPIAVDWAALAVIAAGATACSALAAWVPAARAGRIAPLEILRKY